MRADICLQLNNKWLDIDNGGYISAISLREIARTLERHICLKAAGSKTSAKTHFFRFEKFQGSALEGVLRENLESLGLTEGLIYREKHQGDDVAHDNRDTLTVSEIEDRGIQKF